MISVLSLALVLQQAPAGTAATVVAEATAAVAGDTAQVSARWRARGAAGEDRGARLGLATLARLSYDYAEAERRYRELFPSDWSRADMYAPSPPAPPTWLVPRAAEALTWTSSRATPPLPPGWRRLSTTPLSTGTGGRRRFACEGARSICYTEASATPRWSCSGGSNPCDERRAIEPG